MRKNKIGRNDSCPCGSGRKFKHCCMALDEAPEVDLFTRCNQEISGVKLKLDEAYKAKIKRIRKDARQNFSHYTVDQQLLADQESIFSDWLWFDRLDDDGSTIASDYLNEHQDYMPLPLKDCLSALSKSYLSVYEKMRSGDNFLELRDLFSHSLHQVTLKEPLAAEFNEKPLLLLGRLVSFAEGQVFSGMVLAADNDNGQDNCLRRHVSYLATVNNEPETVFLLKANAEILFGLFEHTLRRKLIPINDIRYLQIKDAEQLHSIQAWLENNSQMCFVHSQAGLHWYQDRQEGMNKMVALADGYVISCAGRLDDLHNWSALPGDAVDPPWKWRLVNSNFLRQSPPPELLSVWFSVLQEQETERWLHTSHPELEDKSPWEKTTEENGIQQVLTMLDQFVARFDEEDEGLKLIAYMRERIETMNTDAPADQ